MKFSSKIQQSLDRNITHVLVFLWTVMWLSVCSAYVIQTEGLITVIAVMYASTVVTKSCCRNLLNTTLWEPAEHYTVRGPDFALYEQNAVFNCRCDFLISKVFSSRYAVLFSIECCIVCTCTAKRNSSFCVKMMSFIWHGESNAP